MVSSDLLVSRSCPVAAAVAAAASVWLAAVEQWLAAGLMLWLAVTVLVVGGLAHRAHLRYLQGEVRALGGEDRWNVRCSHCGRPMRDAASVRHATRTQTPGGGWVERTDGVFHLNRPECSAAADKAGAARPSQAAGPHRVSDEVLNGIVDELERDDR